MTNIGVIDRSKAAVFGLLLAASLLLSALPASAGYRYDGLDFIDASGITWERQPKNITWENKPPKNITWEKLIPDTTADLLRSITWE